MIVILDNIRSAQNVGSIIRTCDALGIHNLYFVGITPDSKDQKVLKTSLGAEKNIKTKYVSDLYTVLNNLKGDGYKIIGLEIHPKAIDISTYKTPEKVALVVGNEVSGLSDEIISLCDDLIFIPMKGIKESLNVAVAFGIAAYTFINK